MITAQRNANREKIKADAEAESKLLLDKEKDYKMNTRQRNTFKKHKKLVKSKGCKMISTVFISSKTKMVIECMKDKTHGRQPVCSHDFCKKAREQPTLCRWCNQSIAAIEARRRTLEEEIKQANETKENEEKKLSKEEIKRRDIELFSSDTSVQNKKDRIRILNADKGGQRISLCIEEKCPNWAGYGYKNLAIRCGPHRLDGEIPISRNQCSDPNCTISGTIEVDGEKYCSKHAIENGYESKKRKWYGSVDQKDVEHGHRMKYTNIEKVKIGRDIENFMFKLLREKILDAKINHVGNQSYPMFDIEIAFEDLVWRGIQVRTLYQTSRCENLWRFSTTRDENLIKSKYPDNTLFISSNKEKSIFVCIYSQDIGSSMFNYDSNNLEHKFNANIFTNLDEFVLAVEKMARKSIKIEGLKLRSKCCQKEYEMMKRLDEFFTSKGIDFQLNENVFSAVDCMINNWNIQCKFSSCGIEKYTFAINTSSTIRLRNGKRKSVPYDLGDNIDFLIVELQSKIDRKKYQGRFLIIPRKALISLGIFQTPTQYGKTGTSVPSPDYHRGAGHSLFGYWNKWEQLKEKKNVLNIDEIREKYTREELKVFAEQEREEKILYLDRRIIDVTFKISSLLFKLEQLEIFEEQYLEWSRLNSSLRTKIISYEINLRKYLKFYDYVIYSDRAENKFFLMSAIPRQRKYRIMGRKNLFDLLELSKQYLPTNTFICLPRFIVHIIMSYLQSELQSLVI